MCKEKCKYEEFFKYVFSKPRNERAALKTLSEINRDLRWSKLEFDSTLEELTSIEDDSFMQCESAEAIVGLITMKHAFDIEGYSHALQNVDFLFRNMNFDAVRALVDKMKLCLGEYINKDALDMLNWSCKSLGQKLGFVSAGDVRRAREQQIRQDAEKRGEAKGREQERAKAEVEFLQQKLASAREMLHDGDSVEKVKRILKLTEEQVALL